MHLTRAFERGARRRHRPIARDKTVTYQVFQELEDSTIVHVLVPVLVLVLVLVLVPVLQYTVSCTVLVVKFLHISWDTVLLA